MASVEVMRHNRTVLASLEEGDLLEFPRGSYSHWAVYIGDDNVIHLAGEDDDGIDGQITSRHLTSFSGDCFNKARIRMDNFFRVAGPDKVKINNNLDKKKDPLPRRQIVKNALSRLNEVGYNVIFKNCQHFATWCRYGEASSDQVEFWVSVGLLGAAAAVVVGGIAAAVKGSNKSKKETQ